MPTILEAAAIAGSLGVVGALFGRPSVAFLASGILSLGIAIVFGSRLVRRVAAEQDPTRELWGDLLLVGVIVLGLIGVGLMAAPFVPGAG